MAVVAVTDEKCSTRKKNGEVGSPAGTVFTRAPFIALGGKKDIRRTWCCRQAGSRHAGHVGTDQETKHAQFQRNDKKNFTVMIV